MESFIILGVALEFEDVQIFTVAGNNCRLLICSVKEFSRHWDASVL